jgi:hypothetical protein
MLCVMSETPSVLFSRRIFKACGSQQKVVHAAAMSPMLSDHAAMIALPFHPATYEALPKSDVRKGISMLTQRAQKNLGDPARHFQTGTPPPLGYAIPDGTEVLEPRGENAKASWGG